jgi:hypothetical protein
MAPDFVPPELVVHWEQPWKAAARDSVPFRALLRDHGYLSPHFTMAEAACQDAARTPVPHRLVRRARNQAFQLERLRHRLGDRPMPVLSWYRTPEWNRRVGGASQSEHMNADACDFDISVVRSLPGFDREANIVYANGGFGQYPGGNRHVDNRGWRARWTSFVIAVRSLLRGKWRV